MLPLVLAQRINFTIELVLLEREKWGTLYPNGSSTGATNLIINRRADFTIGKFAMSSLRNEYMSASMSYYSSPLVIVVPVGEPFTSLEKLMKPFRNVLWTLVMVTLMGAFSVIAFIKWKFDVNIRGFIFGARNTSPYLNTVVVFLGGSLTYLPGRNFARSILCIFMLYCLVVRNSYTGALFTFIRSDSIRNPTVDSIDEMVANDFTFYMIPATVQQIYRIKKIYVRRSVIETSQVPEMRIKMTDPHFEGVYLSSLEQIIYFNMINHKNFTLNVCKEKLFTFQYSIYFQKHSAYIHYFDLQLLDLATNGLINHFENRYVRRNFLKPPPAHKFPKALDMSQVMGSFWILILGLSIASIVAAFEICMCKRNFE